MEYIQPNMVNGYARNTSQSIYPNLWKNLIGYWSPAMGITGNKLYDWSGFHGFSSAFSTSPTPSWSTAKGMGGPSILFPSGAGSAWPGIPLFTADTNVFPTASKGYSFSCWFNTADTSTNLQWFLVSGANGLDSAGDIYIFLNTSGTYVIGGIFESGTEWDFAAPSGYNLASLANSKWHLFTITCDPTGSKSTLYIDGHQIGSTTGSFSYSAGNRPVWLGGVGNVSSGNQWSCGDVGIWNRALSPSEVAQLFTGASPLQFASLPTFSPLAESDTETPSTLSLTAALLAPTINFDYFNSVSTQNLTATLLSPTLTVDCTVTPGVLSLTSLLIVPGEEVDCTITPDVLQLNANLQNPTENYDWTVTPDTLDLTITAIDPADIGLIALLNPDVMVGTLSLIDPTITYDFTVTPGVLQLTASVIAPTENFDCTLLPALLQMTANLQTPSARADVTVTPAVLNLSAGLIAPAVVISMTVTPSTLVLNANLQSPTELGTYSASFASKIISYNPLMVITNTDPLKVVSIDITDPTDPVLDFATFPGLSFGKDAVYNSVFNCIYIACAQGKILQLDASDFGDFEIIDTGDSNNLLKLASLYDFQKLYAATDDNSGEVLYIDEAILTSLNLDIQCLQKVNQILDLDIRTVQGGMMNTNIQCLEISKNAWGLDIRVIADPFDEIALNPIKQTDFHVYINGLEMTDVELDSIQIYHTIGEKSTATFNLKRRHDELNTTIAGYSSQITNQNTVQIYIQNILEFEGKTARVRTDSETEKVEITAVGLEKDNERRTINIPLSSVNEKLHPYHCLVDNEDIYNPYIDPLEENPEFFLGIEVDLGKKITESVSRYQNFSDTKSTAEKVINGDFQPKQNWTYFWFCTARNFLTGLIQATLRYVGTSPSALTSDLWEILGMNYWYQRTFDDIEEELGMYQVGSAPFKKVSVKNGKKITKSKWVDQSDGLYIQKDEGYDYMQFAKDTANLELDKIKNINGGILPKTSCDIEMMIDGYYFYGLKLLTRINIDNTITSGIYNDNNGFPIAVKTIQINSDSMKVSMKCDNEKSDVELKEIDALYPDEEDPKYKFPAVLSKVATKFDYGRFETVE